MPRGDADLGDCAGPALSRVEADVETAPWEYRVEKLGSTMRSPKPELLAEILNQAATEGWEPLHLTPVFSANQLFVVLRRPTTHRSRRRATWPDSSA